MRRNRGVVKACGSKVQGLPQAFCPPFPRWVYRGLFAFLCRRCLCMLDPVVGMFITLKLQVIQEQALTLLFVLRPWDGPDYVFGTVLGRSCRPVNRLARIGLLLLKGAFLWRARWDLNPRSPAPKAGALIQAGLRAPFSLGLC